MYIYNKFFIKYSECAFVSLDEFFEKKLLDDVSRAPKIFRIVQSPIKPISKFESKFWILRSSEFKTYHTNLLKSNPFEDNFKKNVRYEALRGYSLIKNQKHLSFQFQKVKSKQIIYKIFKFFKIFCQKKSISIPNLNKLTQLSNYGLLYYSSVEFRSEIVVLNIYLCVEGRARLLLSGSLSCSDTFINANRSKIGRCVHLLSMYEFKKNDYLIYDFGGVSSFSDTGDTAGIDAYKRGFMGDPKIEYNILGVRLK